MALLRFLRLFLMVVVAAFWYSLPGMALETASESPASAAAVAPPGPSGVPLPQPPTGLSALPGGHRVLLAWEEVMPPPGIASVHYLIYRLDQPPATGESIRHDSINRQPVWGTYYLDTQETSWTPPLPGTTYYYAVATVDDRGNTSLPSAALKVTNVPLLCAPTGFEALAGNREVTLSWNPSFSGGADGLNGYLLYRSTDEGHLGEPLFSAPRNVVEYTDRGSDAVGLENGTTYYYSLVAEDRRGRHSELVGPVAAAPFVPAGAPASLTATGKSDDVIALSWTPAKPGEYPVAGYEIYRGTSPDNVRGPINLEPVTGTTYLDSETNSRSKPILGTLYTYRVRAVDARGLPGQWSEIALGQPRAPLQVPSTGLLSTAIPGLPPDSTLTISGRKKIVFGYTAVTPDSVSPALTSGLTKGPALEQELQVRLEGKVGKKITVDVDYDDTLEEQRKISIIYAGDPGDIIQEAAFGDILLDLPRTQFAGYNKNLFGAKLKLELDRFRFMAIGAQTKGITVTERFKGNASPRTLDKQDLDFVTYKYYYLTKAFPEQVNHPELPGYDAGQPQHGIVPGSVLVYVADYYNARNNGSDTVRVNIGGLEYSFNPYFSGVDYVVDYDRGILTFNTTLNRTATIAVAYRYYDAAKNEISVGYLPGGSFDFDPATLQVPADGRTSDGAHLLQYYNGSYATLPDLQMMLMNRYSLGYTNIQDPKGDNDFVLKIFDKENNEVKIPDPRDSDEADRIYRIDPNFGTITFMHNYPFQSPTEPPGQLLSDTYVPDNDDAYNPLLNTRLGGVNDALANNFRMHLEFKNLITTFNLSHWNIIENSEVIKKDGLKLRKDTDYYIDYDTGFITFLNLESIANSTEITVTYEYMPFGGKFQTNIFGARAEYDLIDQRLTLGSTFLYNASQAPTDIPDVGGAPTALSLLDADARLQLNPDDFSMLFTPLTGGVNIPITLDVSAEAAYSTYESNTYRKSGEDGVAMIDGMDGTDNVLSLSPDNNVWFAASAPGSFPDPADRRYLYQTVVYELGRVPLDSEDKKHQLRWNYANLTSGEWDGFTYPISASGTNLNDYRYLEFSVFADPGGSQTPVLHVNLGVVSEDANGNGNLNFEGEDRLTLKDGEDVGLHYMLLGFANGQAQVAVDATCPSGVYGGGYPEGYWGAGNDRLNTEDMDNNGQLNTAESYYDYVVTLTPGWNYIKIPLAQFDSAGGTNPPTTDTQSKLFLGFVKQARMWLTGASGTPASGYVQFESIQLTGNKWQATAAPGTTDPVGNPTTEPDPEKFNATAVSLETDSAYTPNPYFFIYDEATKDEELRNEKALELRYNLNRDDVVLPGSTTVDARVAYYARRNLTTGTGYDYSGYTNLRVDLYKRTPTQNGELFFIRLGLDENNYYQYTVSLDEVPQSGWHTVTIPLDGSGRNREERFAASVLSGLTQIKVLMIGVINPNPFGADEVLWVNNLRVTDAINRQGPAYRLSSTTTVSDILTVSTDLRDVDSDFYMIDEAPSGKQHVTESQVTGTVTKLPYLPVKASWRRTEHYTEEENRDNPTYSSNYTLPDITQETMEGDVAYSQIQGVDVNIRASRSRKQTRYIRQEYNPSNDEELATLNPSLSIALPDNLFGWPIGSTTLVGRLVYTDYHVAYDPEGTSLSGRTDLWDRWKHSWEENYTYRGNYRPFAFLSFSPSFTYSQTRERGFLSGYKFYGDLTREDQYFSEAFKMARAKRVADLKLSLTTLPVLAPSVTYSRTNERDYVNDTLSIPGSLYLQSSIALGDLLGWRTFPVFNYSENYTITATYKNEYALNPIEDLDFGDSWIIDPFTFQEDQGDQTALANANLYKKVLQRTLGTTIGLIPNVSLTPQFSYNWTEQMNSPGNITRQDTRSSGGGLQWMNLPSPASWLTLQNLNINYLYSENSGWDTGGNLVNHKATHESRLNLPFRLSLDFNGNLTAGYRSSQTATGLTQLSMLTEDELTAGLALAYNFRMSEPITLPNFWPFNGAKLMINQTLRITNDVRVTISNSVSDNWNLADVHTTLVNNDTIVNYSLWKNVEGDVKLTNQWFTSEEKVKNYYAISLRAGLTAIF